MKSNFIGTHEIGEFEVSAGAVEITDPCYAPEDGVILKNVKNGAYLAFTQIIDEGAWGGRNAVLYAVNKKFFTENELTKESIESLQWVPQEEYFGVDSGQGGIFSIDKYPGGEDEDFYEKCCNLTLEGLGAGSIEFGVVSSSGFGDGGYGFEIFTHENEVVAIKVIFIGDEESEEDDIED